jgi:tRNA threonylcarbamoyladenosine biosynthesis protein TsaB
MNLLALDTSSDACSVALERDGDVIERHELRPREHTRLLLPMIEEVLARGDVALPDLDAIVAGIGPGSFIGVRIAVSVAQGMAFAGGRRVVPVSSLAALAAEAFAGAGVERVIVAQDAHRQEVYLARFVRAAGGLPEAVGEATLHGIAGIDGLSGPEEGRWHAAGAGWRRHPGLLERNGKRLAGLLPLEYPRARFLLGAGRAAAASGGALAPDRLAPAYVRQQVAKLPERPATRDTSKGRNRSVIKP